MERRLAVREYEILTCNEEYQEEYAYLPCEIFNELEDFIRAGSLGEESSDLGQFLKLGYRRGVGPVVSVSHYVGLIQLKSGYQIEILPKIALHGEEELDHQKTKNIFVKMLRSLQKTSGKISQDSALRMERMSILEIFIRMYLEEMEHLLQKGLKSAYLRQENNLPYWKGKLLVSEHLRRNLAHQERFYTAYEEFYQNRPENRLLKATLLKLQRLSGSSWNLRTIRQQLLYFEQVDASVNVEKDFAGIVMDRTNREYEPLLRWSRVFLLDKSFTNFSGDTFAKAMLFPMEKIFESYVAKEMKVVFSQAGWEVSSQDRGYFLFDVPKKFALRPDLVVEDSNGRTIVMDTKWKHLTDRAKGNYGISQEDMYQMYAYAKKYKTQEVWLLYPMQEGMKEDIGIRYQSEDNVTVRVYLVDVEHIRESLERLLGLLI